jgi:hypothetical protein
MRLALRPKGVDFDQINSDSLFTGPNGFLDQMDPMTGQVRRQVMGQAFSAGHYDAAARFFEEFHNQFRGDQIAPARTTPDMTQHVKVNASTMPPDSAVNTQPVAWTQEAISQFYADKRRGKYSKEEADMLERQLYASMAT